jgi:hypothetical protein
VTQRAGELKAYLACYDYGMGGLWWRILAPSADAIRAALPQLTVFETEPDWWRASPVQIVREYRLGDLPDEVLSKVLSESQHRS